VVSLVVRDEGKGRAGLHLEGSEGAGLSAFVDQLLRSARRFADREINRATRLGEREVESNTISKSEV
jgi:hypothetical protein